MKPFHTYSLSFALVATVASLTACSGEDSGSLLGQPTGPGAVVPPGETPPGETPPGETPPVELQCTEKPQGRSYKNFDGTLLEASRVNEGMGLNRARIKPFAVLSGELARVLGAAPPSLAGEAGSFEAPPARWFEEPRATGVGLSTLYTVVFEGTLAYAKANPKYATGPSVATAQTECTDFMSKAWNRSPSPNEVTECVTFATTKLAKETNAQRQWAYVFANVLTSTGFLTY